MFPWRPSCNKHRRLQRHQQSRTGNEENSGQRKRLHSHRSSVLLRNTCQSWCKSSPGCRNMSCGTTLQSPNFRWIDWPGKFHHQNMVNKVMISILQAVFYAINITKILYRFAGSSGTNSDHGPGRHWSPRKCPPQGSEHPGNSRSYCHLGPSGATISGKAVAALHFLGGNGILTVPSNIHHHPSNIHHHPSNIHHHPSTSINIHQHHHPSTSQLGQEMTRNMFGERMSLATCCPEIEMQIWDHHGNACKGPGFPSSFVPLACLNQDPSCSQVRAQLSKDCWPLHAGRPGLHLHLVHTSSMTKEELLLQEEVVEIGPSAWVLPSRSICKTHSKAMARFWTIDEVRGGTQLIFVWWIISSQA